MGVAVNSGRVISTDVNIEGGVTLASTKASMATAVKTSAGDATIGTVPASKIWKIKGFHLAGSINNGAGTGSLKLNGTAICTLQFNAGATQNDCQAICYTFTDGYYLELTETQTAVLTNGAAGVVVSASILYEEVDA